MILIQTLGFKVYIKQGFILNKLCKDNKIDFSIIFNYDEESNIYRTSLRSIGDMDVSVIAKIASNFFTDDTTQS